MESDEFGTSQENENILNDFISAVEHQYSQINETRSATFQQVKQLSSKLETLGKTDIVSKIEQKYFIENIPPYLEIVLSYITKIGITNLKKYKKYISMFLNIIKEVISNTSFKNQFVIGASTNILNLFVFEDFDFVIKGSILCLFNEIIAGSRKDVRLATAINMQEYLFKLVDALVIYGDYEIQFNILETLFRIFGPLVEQSPISFSLLPENDDLDQSLKTVITSSEFGKNARSWLNEFNKNSSLIKSIACKSIYVGEYLCSPPKDTKTIWVDFNIKNHMLSFYIAALDHTTLNRIIVLPKGVKKVEIKRPLGTQEGAVLLTLSKPVIAEIDETFWNEKYNTNIRMVFGNENKDIINKLVTVALPQIFGSTFCHGSSRISNSKREVYKPLGIKVSRMSSLSIVNKSGRSSNISSKLTRSSVLTLSRDKVRSPLTAVSNTLSVHSESSVTTASDLIINDPINFPDNYSETAKLQDSSISSTIKVSRNKENCGSQESFKTAEDVCSEELAETENILKCSKFREPSVCTDSDIFEENQPNEDFNINNKCIEIGHSHLEKPNKPADVESREIVPKKILQTLSQNEEATMNKHYDDILEEGKKESPTRKTSFKKAAKTNNKLEDVFLDTDNVTVYLTDYPYEKTVKQSDETPNVQDKVRSKQLKITGEPDYKPPTQKNSQQLEITDLPDYEQPTEINSVQAEIPALPEKLASPTNSKQLEITTVPDKILATEIDSEQLESITVPDKKLAAEINSDQLKITTVPDKRLATETDSEELESTTIPDKNLATEIDSEQLESTAIPDKKLATDINSEQLKSTTVPEKKLATEIDSKQLESTAGPDKILATEINSKQLKSTTVPDKNIATEIDSKELERTAVPDKKLAIEIFTTEQLDITAVPYHKQPSEMELEEISNQNFKGKIKKAKIKRNLRQKKGRKTQNASDIFQEQIQLHETNQENDSSLKVILRDITTKDNKQKENEVTEPPKESNESSEIMSKYFQHNEPKKITVLPELVIKLERIQLEKFIKSSAKSESSEQETLDELPELKETQVQSRDKEEDDLKLKANESTGKIKRTIKSKRKYETKSKGVNKNVNITRIKSAIKDMDKIQIASSLPSQRSKKVYPTESFKSPNIVMKRPSFSHIIISTKAQVHDTGTKEMLKNTKKSVQKDSEVQTQESLSQKIQSADILSNKISKNHDIFEENSKKIVKESSADPINQQNKNQNQNNDKLVDENIKKGETLLPSVLDTSRIIENRDVHYSSELQVQEICEISTEDEVHSEKIQNRFNVGQITDSFQNRSQENIVTSSNISHDNIYNQRVTVANDNEIDLVPSQGTTVDMEYSHNVLNESSDSMKTEEPVKKNVVLQAKKRLAEVDEIRVSKKSEKDELLEELIKWDVDIRETWKNPNKRKTNKDSKAPVKKKRRTFFDPTDLSYLDQLNLERDMPRAKESKTKSRSKGFERKTPKTRKSKVVKKSTPFKPIIYGHMDTCVRSAISSDKTENSESPKLLPELNERKSTSSEYDWPELEIETPKRVEVPQEKIRIVPQEKIKILQNVVLRPNNFTPIEHHRSNVPTPAEIVENVEDVAELPEILDHTLVDSEYISMGVQLLDLTSKWFHNQVDPDMRSKLKELFDY
ncbi:synaptonemal complex protein 2-like isoform X3 [Sitophilus oryzae]|uniref:Synaptonemal complex protein 2-like isoform X3 n=1 Tax=Sitophilus oryzae TaxID=7048 RepID=A0A6J2X2J8_SITOR|nr:synaptonemal complex protein 2-like isoform X3 [Sitophilus oryzae]